jgi:pimeloyl-ACP methyl ester carboxylesterase
MPDIHVLPGIWTAHVGYRLLVSWLRSTLNLIDVTADGPPGNLLPVPYDWRLSNRHNGRLLGARVGPALDRWRSQGGRYADAQVVLVCHSMGGLVARWWIQREGGAEITRKLVTLGTPHRGALTALDQLVNGVRKGPWPFRIDLTGFARSMPSLHQLLPAYSCIESGDSLVTTTEADLPDVSATMVDDAFAFHAQLDDGANPCWPDRFDLHPLHGQKQTTATTARLVNGRIVPVPTIDGNDEGGDATVPTLSATPRALRPSDPSIHHVTERHGSLQSNQSVFDHLEGVLLARDVIHRGPTDVDVDLRVEEVLDAGQDLVVDAVVPGGDVVPLEALLVDERNRTVGVERLMPAGGVMRTVFSPPAEGTYEVRLRGFGSARAAVTPVTAAVLVWGAEDDSRA